MRRGTWVIGVLLIVGWQAWAAPARAAAPLRKAVITLTPSSGAAGIPVTIAGSGFPTGCAGYLLIDSRNTGVSYGCGGDSAFHVTIAWPDSLDDGQHTVEARGIFAVATAAFTQISPTATPAPQPSATPALGASATAANSGGGTTGGSTTTGGGQNVSDLPATLALVGVCCSVGVVGTGVSVLIVALRRRERRMNPYIDTPYVPPPPPPPPIPQNPDEPWVWPNDPHAR
jgi:hypothetical protein